MWVFDAFVDIDAHETCIVQSKTFIARTHETAESVGAVAVLTNVFMFFTFVDIFQNNLNKSENINKVHNECIQ